MRIGEGTMIKTVFISDLDGTLLRADKTVGPASVHILNDLLQRGLLFTVATARSAATAAAVLKPLALTLPGVLLNGALFYDFAAKQYTGCCPIAQKDAALVLQFCRRHGRTPFLYLMEQNEICVLFEQLANDCERRFYEERRGKAYKRFEQTADLQVPAQSRPVYFTMQDSYQRLRPLYDSLCKVAGIRCVFYRDIYDQNNYYLEVFSRSASKSNGAAQIKEALGADRLVAFGDNDNDIDLLRAADVGVVVAGASPGARQAADIVIGSNEKDAVATWIAQNWIK